MSYGEWNSNVYLMQVEIDKLWYKSNCKIEDYQTILLFANTGSKLMCVTVKKELGRALNV